MKSFLAVQKILLCEDSLLLGHALVFRRTINTLLLNPTPTIRHKRVIQISLWSEKNSSLKSHDRESESYYKFKNSLLKFTQLSPWQITFGAFFRKVCHFRKTPFLGDVIFTCFVYLSSYHVSFF